MDTANQGKPWAKLVVPSSGSMIHLWLVPRSGVDVLFGKKVVLRERLLQSADQQRFRCLVNFGDQVDAPLVLDLQRLPEPGALQFAGLFGKLCRSARYFSMDGVIMNPWL